MTTELRAVQIDTCSTAVIDLAEFSGGCAAIRHTENTESAGVDRFRKSGERRLQVSKRIGNELNVLDPVLEHGILGNVVDEEIVFEQIFGDEISVGAKLFHSDRLT